jgi:hypothetical protein
MVLLPECFLQWNYYPRGRALLELVTGRAMENLDRFFLESTRHNPALCTAFQDEYGQTLVNAKIVGVGYIIKRKYMKAAMDAFQHHFDRWEKLAARSRTVSALESNSAEYRKQGAMLLLEHLYFDDAKTAKEHIDFGKMSTIELALSKPNSSKHTWQFVQHNLNSCLLFYQPPSISYELHGRIEIHEGDLDCSFVNAVHDTFHYQGKVVDRNRPAYIFKVDKVFDNGPSPKQFGRRLA